MYDKLRPHLVILALCAYFLGEYSAAGAQKEYPRYEFDPIVDTSIFLIAGGLFIGSQAVINGTDLSVDQPGDVEGLFVIDRWAAEAAAEEPSSELAANITVASAALAVVTSIVFTGIREGRRAGWTDFALYLQTTIVNLALADIVKLAVRRPRPQAYYIEQQDGDIPDDTKLTLSFYSAHTSTVAGWAGTATYLAFRRNANRFEKWITLAVGAGLTLGVAISRVASLSHFPTDVFVGAAVGYSIGFLVPYFHEVKKHSLAIGISEIGQEGQGLFLSGNF